MHDSSSVEGKTGFVESKKDDGNKDDGNKDDGKDMSWLDICTNTLFDEQNQNSDRSENSDSDSDNSSEEESVSDDSSEEESVSDDSSEEDRDSDNIERIDANAKEVETFECWRETYSDEKNGMLWIGKPYPHWTGGKGGIMANYYIDHTGRVWPNYTFFKRATTKEGIEKDTDPFPSDWYQLIETREYEEWGLSLKDERNCPMFAYDDKNGCFRATSDYERKRHWKIYFRNEPLISNVQDVKPPPVPPPKKRTKKKETPKEKVITRRQPKRGFNQSMEKDGATGHFNSSPQAAVVSDSPGNRKKAKIVYDDDPEVNEHVHLADLCARPSPLCKSTLSSASKKSEAMAEETAEKKKSKKKKKRPAPLEAVDAEPMATVKKPRKSSDGKEEEDSKANSTSRLPEGFMTSLREGTQIAQYWYLRSLPNKKNFERWVWLPGTVTTTSDIETTKDEEDKDQEGFNTRIKWDTIKLDGRLVYEGDTCDETLLMKDHLKEFAEIDLYQNQDNWVHGSFANKVLKWQNDGGLKGLDKTKCELVEDEAEEESSSEETEEESSSSVSPYKRYDADLVAAKNSEDVAAVDESKETVVSEKKSVAEKAKTQPLKMNEPANQKSDKAEKSKSQEQADSSANGKNEIPPLKHNLDPYESWSDAWKKMLKSGWSWKAGSGLTDYYFIKPGCKIKGGIKDQDYFESESDAKAYATKNYGWKGEIAVKEEKVSGSRTKVKDAAATNNSSKKKKSKSSSDAPPSLTKKKKNKEHAGSAKKKDLGDVNRNSKDVAAVEESKETVVSEKKSVAEKAKTQPVKMNEPADVKEAASSNEVCSYMSYDCRVLPSYI